MQNVKEEEHETLEVENSVTLVQDQVFVCGDQAVIGAMAKYKSTRKKVMDKDYFWLRCPIPIIYFVVDRYIQRRGLFRFEIF
ncbi:hypothetical protein CR513_36032, partial [Mucuna pruriens]